MCSDCSRHFRYFSQRSKRFGCDWARTTGSTVPNHREYLFVRIEFIRSTDDCQTVYCSRTREDEWRVACQRLKRVSFTDIVQGRVFK